jgi:hypothetical protein
MNTKGAEPITPPSSHSGGSLRLRILKDHNGYKAGQIVDVPTDRAKRWLKKGIAMQDKSRDGSKEIK